MPTPSKPSGASTTSTTPTSKPPLPPEIALRGLEALIPLAKSLHDRGLSAPEIKAAMKKALADHKAKSQAAPSQDKGKIPGKANLGKPGPMPE